MLASPLTTNAEDAVNVQRRSTHPHNDSRVSSHTIAACDARRPAPTIGVTRSRTLPDGKTLLPSRLPLLMRSLALDTRNQLPTYSLSPHAFPQSNNQKGHPQQRQPITIPALYVCTNKWSKPHARTAHPTLVTFADAHLFHHAQVTCTTYRRTQRKRTHPRTQPASATWPLTPASRGPDAPLTRFHATNARTQGLRPESASNGRTSNRDATRSPAPGASGAHLPTTAQPQPPHHHHTRPRTPRPTQPRPPEPAFAPTHQRRRHRFRQRRCHPPHLLPRHRQCSATPPPAHAPHTTAPAPHHHRSGIRERAARGKTSPHTNQQTHQAPHHHAPHALPQR